MKWGGGSPRIANLGPRTKFSLRQQQQQQQQQTVPSTPEVYEEEEVSHPGRSKNEGEDQIHLPLLPGRGLASPVRPLKGLPWEGSRSTAERVLAIVDGVPEFFQHDLQRGILREFDHEHAGLHADVP